MDNLQLSLILELKPFYDSLKKGENFTAETAKKLQAIFSTVNPKIFDVPSAKIAEASLQALIQKTKGFNVVNQDSIRQLSQYITASNLTEKEIAQVIQQLNQEKGALAIGSQAYREKAQSMALINGAYNNIGAASRGAATGQTNMNMSIMQFGYMLNDASMVTVNYRMALMGVANNFPFFIQGLLAAKDAAQKANMTLGAMAKQTLFGAGGVILGINAVMFALQILPQLFSNTTKEVKKQKEELKELVKEYKELSTAALRSRREQLDIEKRILEAEIKIIEGRKVTRKGGIDDTFATEVFHPGDEEKFDEAKRQLNEYVEKIKVLDGVASEGRSKLANILNGKFDITTPNKVRDAIDIIEREIRDAKFDSEAKKKLEGVKASLEKILNVHNNLRNSIVSTIIKTDDQINKEIKLIDTMLQSNVSFRERNELLEKRKGLIKELIGMPDIPDLPEITDQPVIENLQWYDSDKLRERNIKLISDQFERERQLADLKKELALREVEEYEDSQSLIDTILAEHAAERKKIDEDEYKTKNALIADAVNQGLNAAVQAGFAQFVMFRQANSMAQVFLNTLTQVVAKALVLKAIKMGLSIIPGAASFLGFAQGGLFRGAPGVDANLIKVTDKEFIVNPESTSKYLPLLHAINSNTLRGFASGGYTGANYPAMQPMNVNFRVKETRIEGRDIVLVYDQEKYLERNFR